MSPVLPDDSLILYLPEPKAFQVVDAGLGIQKKHIYLGHEMGLGKTLITILGIRAVMKHQNATWEKDNFSCLTVCPASLRGLWDWHFRAIGAEPIMIEMGSDVDKLKHRRPGQPVIFSYELISAPHYLKIIMQVKWDFINYDEAHYLSSPAAYRTRACLKNLFPLSPRNWFASGTPIKNKPWNIWAIASTIDPNRFGNYRQFIHEFCSQVPDDKNRLQTFPGTVAQSNKLGRALKQSFLIRRTKAEVASELGEKEYDVVPLIHLELNNQNAVKDFLPQVEEMLEKDQEPPKNSQIAKERLSFGIWKVPLVADYIQAQFDACLESCVIFVYHHKVLEQLYKFLRSFKVVTVQGGDPQSKRDRARELFQDGKANIFLCTFAANFGITLTRSNHVFFAERSWSYGDNAQAEDRIHRLGQDKTCFITDLILQNSFDEIVYKSYCYKRRTAKHILGA